MNEGASERLFAEVLEGELAQAVVTEPVTDRRLVVEHLLDEAWSAGRRRRRDLPPDGAPCGRFAAFPLVLPPERNPLRIELEAMAEAQGVTLHVPVEVEGIRLIGDLVASGTYASILPETAIPRAQARADRHHRQPPAAPVGDRQRARCAVVPGGPGRPESVSRLVTSHMKTRVQRVKQVRSRPKRG